MKVLDVAILGQGRSGYSIHGSHLLKDTDRFRVTAVVDRLPERREKANRVFGCPVYEDYTELFGKKFDLVVNALPSPFHHPVTIDLLNHGYNVLCEKPATANPAMLDEMAAAAEKNGRMLAIFQQSRFAPYFLKIKEVIASGVLGRLVQIGVRYNGFSRRWDWQCIQDNIAGSLYNSGPHPVDQVLDLLGGEEVPTIFCKMDRVNTYGDAEDYCKMLMTLPGKPVVDLEVSCCDGYPAWTYKIEAEHGSLIGTHTHLDWKWYVPEDVPKRELIKESLTTPDGEPAYCSEKLTWHTDSWDYVGEKEGEDAARGLYTTLYEHLTAGEPLKVTIPQVRRQLAVMEEAHRQNPLSRFCTR